MLPIWRIIGLQVFTVAKLFGMQLVPYTELTKKLNCCKNFMLWTLMMLWPHWRGHCSVRPQKCCTGSWQWKASSILPVLPKQFPSFCTIDFEWFEPVWKKRCLAVRWVIIQVLSQVAVGLLSDRNQFLHPTNEAISKKQPWANG